MHAPIFEMHTCMIMCMRSLRNYYTDNIRTRSRECILSFWVRIDHDVPPFPRRGHGSWGSSLLCIPVKVQLLNVAAATLRPCRSWLLSEVNWVRQFWSVGGRRWDYCTGV